MEVEEKMETESCAAAGSNANGTAAPGDDHQNQESASVSGSTSCDFAAMYPATLNDFDESLTEEERKFCLDRFSDLNTIKKHRMHCTSCNKHLGLSAHMLSRLRMHPLLRTLMCFDCLKFYNSGEFDKGEDGSELYCRWCGQGGQVYCCSSCPTVFCAKCIKRNFGVYKIDEIESIDDWNCFLCTPKVLWCHRAALWAAKRYCALKNKYTLSITDPEKRLKLQQECSLDESECCISKKSKNKTPVDFKKNIKKYVPTKRNSDPVFQKKIPDTLQPIASISSSESIVSPPPAKKFSPYIKQTSHQSFQNKSFVGIPIRNSTPGNIPNPVVRAPYKRTHVRTKAPKIMQYNNGFVPYPGTISSTFGNHSYSRFIPNDNLNLSLESLTAGLDMSNIGTPNNEDNVVCTPDFPMPIEPLCEMRVDEDCPPMSLDEPPPIYICKDKDPLAVQNENSNNMNNDIECLTPTTSLPRLVPKPLSALMSPQSNSLQNDVQIVKMSDKDVTINKATGGLKFRVDPSTLSVDKRYQLPDGRIFSVNTNPRVPGGYSATIVSLNNTNIISTVNNTPSNASMNVNYQDKSASRKSNRNGQKGNNQLSPSAANSSNSHQSNHRTSNAANVKSSDSMEWYFYNLYEAVDLVDYVAKKLHKIKGTPIRNMKSKSVQEIKDLHFALDQALKINCQRFSQIRDNLNSEFQSWLKTKYPTETLSDDDDKVEITSYEKSNIKTLGDPIFIDENSNDSPDKDDIIHVDSVVCDISSGCDVMNKDDSLITETANDLNKNEKTTDSQLKDNSDDCSNSKIDSKSASNLDDPTTEPEHTTDLDSSKMDCRSTVDLQNGANSTTEANIDDSTNSKKDLEPVAEVDDFEKSKTDSETRVNLEDFTNSKLDSELTVNLDDCANSDSALIKECRTSNDDSKTEICGDNDKLEKGADNKSDDLSGDPIETLNKSYDTVLKDFENIENTTANCGNSANTNEANFFLF